MIGPTDDGATPAAKMIPAHPVPMPSPLGHIKHRLGVPRPPSRSTGKLPLMVQPEPSGARRIRIDPGKMGFLLFFGDERAEE